MISALCLVRWRKWVKSCPFSRIADLLGASGANPQKLAWQDYARLVADYQLPLTASDEADGIGGNMTHGVANFAMQTSWTADNMMYCRPVCCAMLGSAAARYIRAPHVTTMGAWNLRRRSFWIGLAARNDVRVL